MAHQERYGKWAGNEAGRKADLSRCCERVHSHGSHISSQCARKGGHGPDGTYCKQHNPVAVRLRQAQSAYKYDLHNYNLRMQRLSTTLPIIKAIADGHNDPRALCQSWLDESAASLTPPVAPKEQDNG
jgi:hypothetical protein